MAKKKRFIIKAQAGELDFWFIFRPRLAKWVASDKVFYLFVIFFLCRTKPSPTLPGSRGQTVKENRASPQLAVNTQHRLG